MLVDRLMNKAMLVIAGLVLPVSLMAQDLPEFNMSNTTIAECQGILYDSGGPDNPYANNEHTTTVIDAGGVITIHFTNIFAFEEALDSLFVYDGPDVNSPLLGAFTGQTLPSDLIANSGFATIVLDSDNNVFAAGFSFEWTSVQPVPIPPDISVNNIPACNASQVNLNLSTPIACTWLPSSVITVTANGQDIPVTSVQPNCAGGFTSTLTIILGQPFTFNCDYTVNFDIEIPDNCDVLYPFSLSTTFLFQNCGVNASITSDTNTICPGSCAEITAEVTGCFTYTYAWNNGLPATAGPHTVCPLTQTTYSVTITEVETNNQVVKTFTLGIENIDILTPDQTVCQSADNLALQASGVGEWSGDGVITGTNQFDPDQANPGLNYVYFETAACIDSVAITVTPISTEDVTAACPGTPAFQLQGNPTGGVWTGPNTTPGGMFDPVSAGTFLVNYDVNGCTDVLTVNVDDIVGPFALDPICQSIWFDTITFSPYGGIWSGTGIVDQSLGVYAPQQMPAGNHQFIYAINGCNAAFDVTILEVNVDVFHTACPQQLPFIPDTSPLPAGGNWTSPDGAIVNASNGTFDPSVIPNNTFTYVLYNAPNGCIDTMFMYVLQTFVTTETLSFCSNDPQVLLDNSVTGDALPLGGTWSGVGVTGNVNAGFSFNPQSSGIGQHTITYTINNCSDNIVINVYPSSLPDTPLNFCSSGDPELISPAILPGGTWSGSGITDASTGLFDPGLAEPGTFYVYWTNPGGCSDSISVTVEDEQVAALSGLDDTYCLQDVDITFSGTPAGGILLGSLGTFTFNPSSLGEGQYQVIYRYTPQFCPQSSDTVDFEIFPELTLALDANDLLICDDQAVTLTATVTGGNPENGYTYTWSNGGFPIATNTSVPGAPSTISVSVTDNCSTPVEASLFIDVVPPILAVVDTSDMLCAGQQGWATAEVALPEGSFDLEWNGSIHTDTLFANAGSSWSLIITDLVNGCEHEESGVIPAYPSVTANFSITPSEDCVAFEDMANIGFIDLSQNGITGTWDFGNGNTSPYSPGTNVNQAYSSPGNYSVHLSIENEGGCTSEAIKALCILPSEPIFIPDIFSPNGDKHNDTLFVRGFGLTKLDFHLYDRWGEEVFYTDNVKIGWDGQVRGQPASTGSYFYTMKANLGNGNSKAERSGEIVLVR